MNGGLESSEGSFTQLSKVWARKIQKMGLTNQSNYLHMASLCGLTSSQHGGLR